MTSWFSLSLLNPFNSQEDDDGDDDEEQDHLQHSSPSTVHSPTVKEDLSVLGQTFGRQLRGVASFLAPPPISSAAADDTASSSETFEGIKNDLVEIGGSLKTGLSLFSANKAVTEISKFATNFLQFQGEGEEDEEGVGITEEVVEFVREISKRPEFWTDFPLKLHDDYGMTDVQREHAATIEDMVPSLVVLRDEICKYLSEEQFWMIYFILLLPRLDEKDSKLLSTPEIVKVRKILLQKLQNKNNASVETTEVTEDVKKFKEGLNFNSTQGNESPAHSNEVPAEGVNIAQNLTIDHQENSKWVEEKDVNTCTSVGNAQKHSVDDAQKHSEDDISFSDLEDDDNDLSGRLPGINRVSSCSESNEWVRLNEKAETLGGQQKAVQSTSRGKDSEGEESSDWLTIDDADFDS